MPAKKSPSKKTAAVPVASPQWDGPYYNPHSCLIRDNYEIPVSKIPILPEYIIACLSNLAASEHQSDDNTIVPGAAEWCVQFIGRVLREAPTAMQDALALQCGTDQQQGEREAKLAARHIAVFAATATNEAGVPMITISDLFDLMKKHYPRLFPLIPKKRRAQANWLTSANLKFLKQRRGKAVTQGMRVFEAWAKSQMLYMD